MDSEHCVQPANQAADVPTGFDALRGLVLEGAGSELGPIVDADFFAELRRLLPDRD